MGVIQMKYKSFKRLFSYCNRIRFENKNFSMNEYAILSLNYILSSRQDLDKAFLYRVEYFDQLIKCIEMGKTSNEATIEWLGKSIIEAAYNNFFTRGRNDLAVALVNRYKISQDNIKESSVGKLYDNIIDGYNYFTRMTNPITRKIYSSKTNWSRLSVQMRVAASMR